MMKRSTREKVRRLLKKYKEHNKCLYLKESYYVIYNCDHFEYTSKAELVFSSPLINSDVMLAIINDNTDFLKVEDLFKQVINYFNRIEELI